MDWSPTIDDTVSLSGTAYTMEAGNRLNVSSYAPPSIMALEADGEFSGQSLVGTWRRNFSAGSDIEIRSYFDRTDRKDLNYREVRDTVDFDFIHHLPRGMNDVVWGGGAHISPSRFYQTVPTVDFTPARSNYSVYSGFAQDSISIAPDRLIATFGSKFERNSYSGFEIQPSVRASYTPNDQQTFWGAFTRAVRTPSRIEEGFHFTALADPRAPLYLRLVGDGQFDSEQLLGFELGYRAYLRNRGIVSLSTFYNSYDNLLSVENRPSAPEEDPAPAHLILPLFLRNGIQARTKGLEAASLWDVREWWRLRPSYSFLHLNASRAPGSNDASTVNQLEGDSPSHKVVVRSQFTLPREMALDVTYRYVSEIPNQKVRAYSTADLRISKRLSKQLELSLVGQNLMQPHHAEYGGLPGAQVEVRRSAYFKLVWIQ